MKRQQKNGGEGGGDSAVISSSRGAHFRVSALYFSDQEATQWLLDVKSASTAIHINAALPLHLSWPTSDRTLVLSGLRPNYAFEEKVPVIYDMMIKQIARENATILAALK